MPAAAEGCEAASNSRAAKVVAAGSEGAQEAALEEWGEVEGAERQRRRALAAGVVVRGCVVMETVCRVCDVLWSVPVMPGGSTWLDNESE